MTAKTDRLPEVFSLEELAPGCDVGPIEGTELSDLPVCPNPACWIGYLGHDCTRIGFILVCQPHHVASLSIPSGAQGSCVMCGALVLHRDVIRRWERL